MALGLDASAVGFGYRLCYREAEAAARLLDAGQPVEALEDVRKFRAGYAWTLIPDLDAQLPVYCAGPHGYALSLWAVFHRVIHEGEYCLLHPHGVHVDETAV